MKGRVKAFVGGVATGVVLMVVLGIGGSMVFKFWAEKSGFLEKAMETTLRAPHVKTGGHLPESVYAWRLWDIEGRETSFEQFRGKIVFLNIWATWCLPCKAEFRSIGRLMESVRSDEVQFLFVSFEDTSTVKEFSQSRNLDLPFFSAEQPREDFVFTVQAFPTTFVISPAGEIIFRHVGPAKWDSSDVRDLLLGQSNSYPRQE